MKSLTAIGLLLLLFAGAGIAQTTKVDLETFQGEEISLQREWTVGLEYGPDEPYLRNPLFLAVDRQQRVFIADRMAYDIKVYDADGRFLRTIGREGRGPGEFSEINTFTLIERDGEQRLLVSDRTSKQLTEFNLSGEVIRTTLLQQFRSGRRWPNLLLASPDSDYLVSLNIPREGGNVLHRWDAGFSELQNSFMNMPELADEYDENYTIYTAFDRTSLAFIDNNTLIYSPAIYLGEVYIAEGLGSGNPRIRTAGGRIHTTPSAEAVEPKITDGEQNYTSRINSFGEDYAFLIHNFSLGLFRMNSGHIAHFTSVDNGNAMDFGVEIYSSEGQMLHYEVIESVLKEDLFVPNRLLLRMRGMDEQNNLYLLRAVDGQPVVEKYSFSWGGD